MPPQVMSNEDFSLIKSFILLPIILSVFERDASAISHSLVVKSPEPYVDAIHAAMDRTTVVLKEVRKEMRNNGIKVFDVERNGRGVQAEYLCRGYTGTFSMLWSLVQAEVSVRMRAYMGVDISEYVRSDLPEDERQIIHT